MNRLNKYFRYSCYALALILLSCVRDGLDECPVDVPGKYSSYIQFVYDYNMSFEDLFHREVSSLSLYLFDEDNVFLHKMTEKSPSGTTFPKGYTVGILKEFSNATQFVVYAGVDENQQDVSILVPGKSTLNDLDLVLRDRKENIINTSIPPLWHGNITNRMTRASVIPNDTTTISLVKNTNTIRIVLQSLTDNIDVDVNEFSFSLRSVNGSYDAFNVTNDKKTWFYHPYIMENIGEGGAVAELNTLRLLADRENRLVIKHLATNSTILDININKYLNALKLSEYSKMSFEEYLDREDEYKIVVFLTATKDPTENKLNWVSAYMSINEWVLRDQGGEI